MPIGVYETTVLEVERHLVQSFPSSLTRRPIYIGWRQRRQNIAALVPIDSEWTDGSFVSSKRDPGDVDVVTFIDGDQYESLKQSDRDQLEQLFLRVRNKLRFGCDGFMVPIRHGGHPLRAIYEAQLTYWSRVWSHDRDGRGKGFLDVRGEP